MRKFLHHLTQRSWLMALPWLLLMAYGNAVQAASLPSFYATASGPTSHLTLVTSLHIADADVGQIGNTYLTVHYQDQVYHHNGTAWVLFAGGALPVFMTAPLADQVIEITWDADLSGMIGAQLSVGYGLTEDDMLSNGKSALVYTVMDDSSVSQAANFSATASGPTDNMTLMANLYISTADLGQPGLTYLVAFFQNQWFIHDGSQWLLYTDGPLPAYRNALLIDRNIEVFREVNLTSLIGAQVFVGYGLDENDMVSNGKYAMVYAVTADGQLTDITAPTVSSAIAQGAISVAIDTTINATFSEVINPATLTRATVTLMQGTTPVPGTLSHNGLDLVFTPDSPLSYDTGYTATIQGGINGVKDLAGNPLVSDYVWGWTTAATPVLADTTAPTASSAIANEATEVATNSTVNVTFSEAMNPDSFTAMTVSVLQGSTPVAGTLSYNGLDLIFTPTALLSPNTLYTTTILGGSSGVKDLAGNPLSSSLIWSWTTATTQALTDTTPPTVITAIAHGAANVAVDATINATFSEAMNPATLTTTAVTVLQGSVPVPGTLSYSGLELVFTPYSPLDYDANYTATIYGGSSGAKDLAGNSLVNDFVWSWTTAASPVIADTTAPTVSGGVANGATEVAVDAPVYFTFSEAMNAATLTSSTVKLMQGTTPVPGTVSYNGLDLVFTPTEPLSPNTPYTVIIQGGSSGVKDLAGNPLPSDLSWSWTTAAAPVIADTTAPTATSNIMDGATGIPINTTVDAMFSETMEVASLNGTTVTVKQGTQSVPGTLDYVGWNLIFTPSSTLATGTQYTATIQGGANGAKDLAGNPLANDLVWSWTTAIPDAPPVDSTAPTVNGAISDGATGVPINTTVTANFSEAMQGTTVNNTSVTLMQGSTPVPGTLNYAGTTLAFTPSSPLLPNTAYTATIQGGSNGVTDLAGNPMLIPYVWGWTTGSTPLSPVLLGTAGNFAILAKTGISTVPPSAVTGDLGVSPAAATYITGFTLIADATNVFSTSTQVTGKVYAADYAVPTPSNLTTAISDMQTAYTDAAGRPTPDFTNLSSGAIGGLTLAPGLYNWGSSVTIPTDVTIAGGPNDIWIFQISGDLIMSSGQRITLSGGAQAKNIFWQVAGQVTIGTTAHFEGVLLSQTAITLQTGATMNGRMLAQTQAALQGVTLVQPAP